ncbi:MAG: DMT family transporter [Coriobacteriia bacterium]|nr:DMT family transporter [Coriobacteriia bacterium]
MEYIGPFLFNGVRLMLATAALSVILLIILGIRRMRRPACKQHSNIKVSYIIKVSLLCGIILFVASNTQQIGLVTVTASKAAFITALYIVLVPVVGLFLKQKTRWNTWVSVGVAVAGLYLLCVSSSFTLALGDIILIVCALFWAFHILAVGHYAPLITLLQLFGMCTLQFAIAGILSLVCAPLADQSFVSAPLTFDAVTKVAPELLYAGLLSTGGAFTLAAVAQRHAKPTPAAIVMSTESVFGLLGGMFLLGETMSAREGVGCFLMLVAVLLTQWEFKRAAPS